MGDYRYEFQPFLNNYSQIDFSHWLTIIIVASQSPPYLPRRLHTLQFGTQALASTISLFHIHTKSSLNEVPYTTTILLPMQFLVPSFSSPFAIPYHCVRELPSSRCNLIPQCLLDWRLPGLQLSIYVRSTVCVPICLCTLPE